MDYPIWQIPYLGGGSLVALIAVVHVYVAHFAVGGGLFLVLTEMRGRRQNNQAILDYCHKHTKFFLLLTMVFGSLTGVAIWFIIALTNPTATLTLIHTFTMGWATEWVFFLTEIITLLVYYYTFKTMEARAHVRVGWLYFGSGFMSLVLINGIICFMLTPGDWLATGDFWDGFFNPTFWPSLFFRSMMGFSIAGLFGFFTASRWSDESVRADLARYNALWTCIPLVLMAPLAWWYYGALPEARQAMVAGGNTEILPMTRALFYVGPAILGLGLFMALRLPRGARRWVSVLLLVLGLMQIGAFEWVREAARRPFVIAGHTYSTSVRTAEAAEINEKGWLQVAKWVKNKTVTDENRMDAGKELFNGQCLPCHSVGGPVNDILPLTAKFSVFGMDSQLDGQGKLRMQMPPFMGTGEERMALSEYIVVGLHGGDKPAYSAGPGSTTPTPVEVPPFDKDKDEYVLLAWNNLGMHCISDSDPWWVLLPPANDIYAQLVRRGEVPERVTEGVTLRYKVEKEFENPAGHVRFWEFAKSLFGAEPPKNVGLAGKGLSGEMELNGDLGCFHADLVPVVPYPDAGGYNPYPLFTVEARDESGKVLATTRIVAPTATEMGCRNCHGGEWRVGGVAGFTDETSRDILVVHDKINGTDLVAQAEAGKPKLCQSCHEDPVLGTKGRPDTLSFPAALHGWHANYLSGRGAEACAACHPNNPEGPTSCLRGVHDEVGLDCTSCHGTLEDHALSLLKKEQENGKKAADRFMKNLAPRTVDSVEAVNPRIPWLQEPDCLNCHKGFEPPETMDGFNTWTKGGSELFRLRHDDMGALMCEACHGSTHAVYPARKDSGYGVDRDNIPALQYMGKAQPMGKGGNCGLCHVGTAYTAKDSAHHPMGFR
ncbi:cytochrome C [Desulfocurvus sp. DL9XJH121]